MLLALRYFAMPGQSVAPIFGPNLSQLTFARLALNARSGRKLG
jgi:hypothetical protein